MKHVFFFLSALCMLALPSHAADTVVTDAVVETTVQDPEAQLLESDVTDEAEGTTPAVDTIISPTVASGAEASAADVQLPIDLKAAADIVLEAYGGEVVKAEETPDESGLLFTIRVVNEGRVKDVVVDAANGDIVQPLEEPKPEVVKE